MTFASVLGVTGYKTKLRLSSGPIAASGKIRIEANISSRCSISLFVANNSEYAVIATTWSNATILSSTSSFNTNFTVALDSSAQWYEITNNTSSACTYSLFSLIV